MSRDMPVAAAVIVLVVYIAIVATILMSEINSSEKRIKQTVIDVAKILADGAKEDE
jgi:hypothetical protein